MAVVEAGRHREPEGGDENEGETMVLTNGLEEETPEMKLPKSVLMAIIKPRPEISNYDGNLSTEALLD